MELESVQRLSRDLRAAATTITMDEARYLVDYYYAIQGDRIRATHQERTLDEAGEPHGVVTWLGANTAVLEQQVKRALDAYTDGSVIGMWAKSITGIGPIIAAGLAAHIDIEKAPTVGHIWRFAGLDPTVTWEKKTKRPWNATLKTLSWKVGESFVKVSSNENDVYGKRYLTRKAYEIARNDAGELKEQAELKLQRFKIGKDTDAFKHYSMGKLPPAHIHARAKRWTVKLFLSHYHHVLYESTTGAPPPKPYILTPAGGHVDFIAPPNWPMGT